jgi:alkanesulfonate monooxygenase SsuD/methylene tetrahydromethanopterin reductase-like flavin-dependent oxidoreductase (luciferase family)
VGGSSSASAPDTVSHEYAGYAIDPESKRFRFDENLVAVLRAEVAFHIGVQGRGILAVPYASLTSVREIAGMVSEYERGLDEPPAQTNPDAVFALHAHVADTDDEARAVAAGPFERYVGSRLYARRQSYDEVLASGLRLFGSVETVTRQLVELYGMGVRHVMLLQNFGLMPPGEVQRSMRLVAEQVMPAVPAVPAELGENGRISA